MKIVAGEGKKERTGQREVRRKGVWEEGGLGGGLGVGPSAVRGRAVSFYHIVIIIMIVFYPHKTKEIIITIVFMIIMKVKVMVII